MGTRPLPPVADTVMERVNQLIHDGLPVAWISDDVRVSEYQIKELVKGTPEGPLLQRNGAEFKQVWSGIIRKTVLLAHHQDIFTKRIDKGVKR